MTFRVIQWATGGVGRAAMDGVLRHPDLELVGAWVHSPSKEGVDLGRLLGRAALGVAATGDTAALLAIDADCVVYSPFMANPAVVTALLESGKNVVTPLGWFYPPPDERVRMDAVARDSGVTLHGTGIHPGGITERFPLMISALSGSITVDGQPVVTAAVNWLMGQENLDPAWEFGQGGERFEVEVTGDPNCLTTFKKLHPQTVDAGLVRNPGIVATALHCVNAIPYVCRAEPGLLTYLDLPLVAGRAASGLHRNRRGVESPSRP